jgi:putative endonuclease
MAFVYILQSGSTKRFYVGSTDSLDRRMSEHLRGHSLATRGRGPWKLVYTEEYPTLLEARRREWEIKRWKSSKLIASLISERLG